MRNLTRFLSGVGLFTCLLTDPTGVQALDLFGNCRSEEVTTHFDTSSLAADAYNRKMLQRGGSITMVDDPTIAGNPVAFMETGGKSGKKVGKAHFSLPFSPRGAGSVIAMQGRFLFPTGSSLNSVILMDLECASCGVDTNPGIRLYLRDGHLRVDRSKIGLKDPFLPSNPVSVKAGSWQIITWLVTLGSGAEGHSTVYLDDALVMDSVGTTLLTQAEVNKIASIRVQEQVDRFQIGLTANSNKSRQSLYLDDVAFCVK